MKALSERKWLPLLRIISPVIIVAFFGFQNGAFGETNSNSTISVDAKRLLTIDEARQYMLALINKDRAQQGVGLVNLDTSATEAAQKHCDEMGSHGYLSHWDTNGHTPIQRYTESGGQGAVFENVYTSAFSPVSHEDAFCEQSFLACEIEQAERWFTAEVAPYDWHRQNLLDPHHELVGLGLHVARNGLYGRRITIAQEFVNKPCVFVSLPNKFTVGQSFSLQGHLAKGLSLHVVQLCWESLPQPKSVYELNTLGAFLLPRQSVETFFPIATLSGSSATIKQTDNGEEFSVILRPGERWQKGLYYIVVWAKGSDNPNPFIAATHTVEFNEDVSTSRLAEASE